MSHSTNVPFVLESGVSQSDEHMQ